MSVSRPREPLEADRGPNLSSRDYAAARQRQPLREKQKKHKRKRRYDEDAEPDEDEDDEDARMGGFGQVPGMSSAKQARVHAQVRDAMAPMGEDDWSEEADVRPANKRFSSALEDDDDRACVARPLRAGEREAIMDAYLQERAARIRQDQQDHGRMEDEDQPAEEKKDADADTCEALFARMRLVAEAERADAVMRTRIYTRGHLATDKLVGADIRQGDVKLAKIRQCLTEMGYTRSQFQELFHNKFTQAVLPQIYGQEWPECSERVLEEFGIKKISYEVLIQTSVRSATSRTVCWRLKPADVAFSCVSATGLVALARPSRSVCSAWRSVTQTQSRFFLFGVSIALDADRLVGSVKSSLSLSFPSGCAVLRSGPVESGCGLVKVLHERRSALQKQRILMLGVFSVEHLGMFAQRVQFVAEFAVDDSRSSRDIIDQAALSNVTLIGIAVNMGDIEKTMHRSVIKPRRNE